MAKIRRFSDSLPMLLLRARETAMARFRPVLHEHGLTEQQWRVLRALDELGELTAAGLAKECCILAPSVTRILRKLSAEELVSMSPSKTDQRERNVRLSVKGKRAVEAVGPAIEAEYDRICAQLSPGYLASLSRDLTEFIEIGGE